MTAAGSWMKTSDTGREMSRRGSGEWAGIGWTDSSWELAHGLEVVEDLPPDAWPVEFPRSGPSVPAPAPKN